MNRSRDEYLHRRNVANYTRQLGESPEARRRAVLVTLLAEESAQARAKGWRPIDT